MNKDDAPLSSVMSRPEKTETLTRGVCRYLLDLGMAPLRELKLTSRRRADVAAIDRDGKFIIVEVKSSLDDFRADLKWPEYIPHADLFYFAVSDEFPIDRLPEDNGVLIADGFGAVQYRAAVEHKMNGNRRRHQILRFARQSALRLNAEMDPRR